MSKNNQCKPDINLILAKTYVTNEEIGHYKSHFELKNMQ